MQKSFACINPSMLESACVTERLSLCLTITCYGIKDTRLNHVMLLFRFSTLKENIQRSTLFFCVYYVLQLNLDLFFVNFKQKKKCAVEFMCNKIVLYYTPYFVFLVSEAWDPTYTSVFLGKVRSVFQWSHTRITVSAIPVFEPDASRNCAK